MNDISTSAPLPHSSAQLATVLGLHQPVVSGIVNLTPDSFHHDSRANAKAEILQLVRNHIAAGASIIDLGAASSRPGATPVPLETERNRIVKAVKLIREAGINACLSIDTYHAAVAKAGIEAGADWVNDISAGEMDDAMFATVAKLGVPYVMMHMQGTPATMQSAPHYENVVREVYTYFERRTAEAQSAGIRTIVIDPGLGFGKTVAHNYQLLNEIARLKHLGYPVLIGASRKSMINKVLGTTPDQALNGTTVVNTLALHHGANILRVHDVKEACEAVQIVTFTRNCTS